MKKFAFVLLCAALLYTDVLIFGWLRQYFFGRNFAREEYCVPVLIFSVLGTALGVVYFANFPIGLNRWVKCALIAIGLPPMITFFALLLIPIIVEALRAG